MIILFCVAFIMIIAFILAFLNFLFGKSESTFMQNFTGIFIVIIVIVILSSILEMSGCNPQDEPNYPIKYSE